MKQKTKTALFIGIAAFTAILSVWGPESLAKYQDRGRFQQIYTETANTSQAGYLYKLGADEKLTILSRCLNSQTRPESEQHSLTHPDNSNIYPESDGSYAFVANYRNPYDQEISDDKIYDKCNDALSQLKAVGILPDDVMEMDASSYDATLYSAIDVLEPRNNIAVWMLNLKSSPKNTAKENRLMDVCMDAEDGKIYEFFVRTSLLWEDIDTDRIMEKWARYMGLDSPAPYESDNPLLESTPYYKKYVFSGAGGESTIVTIGFYEGINELFLKISR